MRRTRTNAYSRAAKARWADPIAGAEWRDALRHPANRAKLREITKARWADPLMREKIIAGMKTAAIRRRNKDTADKENVGD
jgi:hypothetical protein